MQIIGYFFFRFFVFIFSLLPFSWLYRLSDGVSFFLYKILKYRKTVVVENLTNSFPDKSALEIDVIARKSYQNLADILLEGIKGFSMSEKTLRQRYVFTNPEILSLDKSSIHMAAHYGNWEWGTMAYAIFIKQQIVGFYKPLKNKQIDAHTQRTRGNTGMALVSIGKTAWAFEHFKDRPTSYVLVSDQNPARDKPHWIRFLNQDTACLYGGDKYARQLNYPVYFVEIQRVKRGFYEVTLELLTDTPSVFQDGEITEMYMQRLEKQILAKPEDWLWSHKRWKMKRNLVEN